MVATMAASPIIFALANPTPEIMPEEIKAVRNDAIIAKVVRITRIKSTTPYASPIFLEGH